jgi:hypothetical protein
MKRKSLKEVIMERDCLSEDAADELIEACRAEIMERIADPATCDEMPYDILQEYFGLEPDYLDDIIEL